MKEELLEAIYGTVERLEQKVDELSASPKYAGAETVPASNDTTKLEKSIIAMFGKEEEVRGKISKLRDAIIVFADLIKVELGKNEQRSKFLVDAVKQMRLGNDVSSKALQDKLEVMNKSPQKKVVTHRFEPTSKNVLLFIGGLVLSLVISIWGNLTQWREHQDWEEADLKYRALKMVLSADDPNILYIEKHFSVNRDENVIDYVKNRVAAYEDSVLKYNEMVRMAAYKDSVANELRRESNSIKRTIKNIQYPNEMEFTFKSISLGHIIKTVYLFLITYSNSSKFSYPNSIKTWRLCFLSSSVLNLGIMGRRRMILSLCLA